MIKLQRLTILLVALCLVVVLEGMMLRSFTSAGEEAAAAPTASPEPSAGTQTQTQPTPVNQTEIPTPAPTMPGFTSPPVGGSGTGSSGGGSDNNSGGGSNASPTKKPAAPTKKPDPTPAPTTPPPPTDAPGTTVGSGSFASNTGTKLNMSVSWEARDQGNGTCRVYINGTVNSYSLQVASHPVSISLGSYSTSVMGKSLNVTGSGMSSSSLFSTYIDVPSGTTGSMTVSWRYNGTYSEVEIDDVVASGNVYTS